MVEVAWTRLGRRLLDLAGYAVGLTVAVAALLAPASLFAGAGWNGVKFGLFVVGTLCFGYATVLLWPSRPDARRDGGRPRPERSRDGRPEAGRTPEGPRTRTRFEAALDRVPPLRWVPLGPADRFHPGTKLYAASLLMLAVSYVMEAAFGVRA